MPDKKQVLKFGGIAILAVAALSISGVALGQSASSKSGGVVTQYVPLPAPLPPPTVAPTRKNGAALRTLFAGDSLTGALYASQQKNGFKWLMLDQLQKSGPVQEFNSAITGGTTLDVSAKYEVPKGLDLAVVELGTNDLGKVTPLDQFGAAYGSLLDRITQGSPGVALVCAGVWEGNGGGPEGPTYDAVITDQCERHGGVFVSLRELYRDPATIGPAGLPAFTGKSDDFHPNDTGHRAIADALLARIKVA